MPEEAGVRSASNTLDQADPAKVRTSAVYTPTLASKPADLQPSRDLPSQEPAPSTPHSRSQKNMNGPSSRSGSKAYQALQGNHPVGNRDTGNLGPPSSEAVSIDSRIGKR